MAANSKRKSVSPTVSGRLLAHLGTPLYRNGYALIFSSTTSSALGMVYWLLAARTYTATVVGLNAAAISAMMFLAGASQLNLFNALLRFLPRAGEATRAFVTYAYLISVSVAAIVSFVFMHGLNRWAPTLRFLATSPFLIGWFMLATMAYCIFMLQDSVLTALRQTMWVPIENTAFALFKIVLLIGLAVVLPRYGIFASWTIALAATLLPVNTLIFRRLAPRHVLATRDRAQPFVPRQVAAYVAGDYLGALCSLAATTLLPLMVAQQAGPAASAYYYLTWQIAYAVYFVSPNMSSSLIVEAANDPEQLGAYSYRAFVQIMRIVAPLAGGIMLAAPYILGLFGAEYAAGGTTLLRLLALSVLPQVVNSIYISVARVQRRIKTVAAIQGSFGVLVLILSHYLLPVYGIAGAGAAWLISQTLIAAVLLPGRLRPLWSSPAALDARERAAL